MLASAERTAQRRVTAAFIAADPVVLGMRRTTKIPDGAGGFVQLSLDEAPLIEVIGRMIPQSDKVLEVQSNDGRWARIEYVLMCMPEADIARYDIFSYKGREWQILQLHLAPEYELKADVVIWKQD